jgi:hypothetical protein
LIWEGVDGGMRHHDGNGNGNGSGSGNPCRTNGSQGKC